MYREHQKQNSQEKTSLRTAIAKEQDIDRCLDIICARTSAKHAVYHLAHHGKSLTDSPYVRTNYPAEWVRRYLLRNYVDIDPVVQRGFTSTFPFFWNELELDSADVIEFFSDAISHGVGLSGVSIPVCDKTNRRALLSMSSDMPALQWRDHLTGMIPEIVECANFIHRKVTAELFACSYNETGLSPRELECLSWIARGKDCKAISIILAISEHTVRDYLKSARFKLGCSTLAHAVHRATSEEILTGLSD